MWRQGAPQAAQAGGIAPTPAPQPAQTPQAPVSGVPVSPAAFQQAPVSGAPMPVSGVPVSGVPASGVPASGVPASGIPVSPAAFQHPAAYPMVPPPTTQQPTNPQTGWTQSGQPQTGQPQTGYPQSGHPQQYGNPAPVSPAAYQHPGTMPVSGPPRGTEAEATQRLRPMTPAPPRTAPMPQAPPPQAYVSPAAQPAVYAPPPREQAPPPPRASRNWAVPLLVGILVLALGLAGYVVFQNRDKNEDRVADNTTSAAPQSQSADGPKAIPAYNREDEPAWVPNGWRDQGFGAPDQLWKSQSESEGGRCDTGNGRLRVTTDAAPGLTGCTLKPPLDAAMTDGSIEAKVKVNAGCGAMWLRTGDHGYSLGLCDDNHVRLYRLYKDLPGEKDLLKDWAIKPADGVTEPFVAFKVEGNQLSASVNGVALGVVTNDELHQGKVNLGAFTLSGKTADASFTQVRVFMPEDWQPGSGPTTYAPKTKNPQPSTSSSGWNSKSPSTAPTSKKPSVQPTA
jgi:hypothetical protein